MYQVVDGKKHEIGETTIEKPRVSRLFGTSMQYRFEAEGYQPHEEEVRMWPPRPFALIRRDIQLDANIPPSAKVASRIKAAYDNPLEGIDAVQRYDSADKDFYRLRQAVFQSMPSWKGDLTVLRAAIKTLIQQGYFQQHGYNVEDDLATLYIDAEGELITSRLNWLSSEVLPQLRQTGGPVSVDLPQEARIVFDPQHSPPQETFQSIAEVENEIAILQSKLPE